MKNKKDEFVQMCRQYTPYPSPPEEKKKEEERRNEKKKKKIPCSQWCRMLAWDNRLARPTDKDGEEEGTRRE